MLNVNNKLQSTISKINMAINFSKEEKAIPMLVNNKYQVSMKNLQ